MNKFIGLGRLTADPNIKYSGETVIASFTTAIDRRFKRDGEATADFIPCVAFGKQAEFIEKYFKKGMRISYSGRIQTGSYTNRDGQKVYTTNVVIEEAEFCESKNQTQKAETKEEVKTDDGFVNLPDGIDEELPFN